LKLNCDKLLSNFGFKCKVRHYGMGAWDDWSACDAVGRCRLTLL